MNKEQDEEYKKLQKLKRKFEEADKNKKGNGIL